MSLLDNFFTNMVQKPDYPYSMPVLVGMTVFISLMFIGNIIILYMARKNLHKLGSTSKTMEGFYYAILALIINPLGGVIAFLYRTSVQNASAILIRNANFQFIISGSLFTIFFSTYVTTSVNLSQTGHQIYKLLTGTLYLVSPLAFLAMLYNEIYPLNKNILSAILAVLAIIFFSDILITIMISFRDYRRISNKLLKARLGMSILTGIGFLIEGISAILYLVAVLLQGAYLQIIPICSIGLYSTTFLMAVTLYWGYFIPMKIQEWTGILPPSYKLLKQKQKTLQIKTKIQG